MEQENKLLKLIAAIFLIAVVGYVVCWFFGFLYLDMAAFFMILTLITGVFWLVDRIKYHPQRKKRVQALKASEHYQQQPRRQRRRMMGQALDREWYLEWTAGIFPIILLIFVLRTFIYEPFYIPSGSMMPTLQVKDLILVDKNVYGIKLPLLNVKLTAGKAVQRGDIVVFNDVSGQNIDMIKRVIGLPADKIEYRDKVLYINGQQIEMQPVGQELDDSAKDVKQKYVQTIGEHKFYTYIAPQFPVFQDSLVANFDHRANCSYDYPSSFNCEVPAGAYFVMGDNRDNSSDSRYWGFVPQQNIVGKAVYVWLNLTDIKRRGGLQNTAQ